MADYNLSRLTALVVEKHAPMRRVVREVLKELGLDAVYEAHTIEDAYDQFRRNGPDLVFTDWSPTIDAINLLNWIRRDPDSEDPFAPVIILTAFTEAKHVMAARDAGMSEFLAKPISPKLIYYRIRSIVEKNRPFVKVNETYFGPDRRRRKAVPDGKERRQHANIMYEDRRKKQIAFKGKERRQGYPGYQEADRRIRMRGGKRLAPTRRPTPIDRPSKSGLSAKNFPSQ